MLYLAVRNLEKFGSPNVGTKISGWQKALPAVTIYPREAPHTMTATSTCTDELTRRPARAVSRTRRGVI
jgi:hypothetical protein